MIALQCARCGYGIVDEVQEVDGISFCYPCFIHIAKVLISIKIDEWANPDFIKWDEI